MSAFPPEKDLTPGDTTVAAVVPPEAVTTEALAHYLKQVRRSYRQAASHQMCDVVLFAVPAGKGEDFVDGLMVALNRR